MCADGVRFAYRTCVMLFCINSIITDWCNDVATVCFAGIKRNLKGLVINKQSAHFKAGPECMHGQVARFILS